METPTTEKLKELSSKLAYVINAIHNQRGNIQIIYDSIAEHHRDWIRQKFPTMMAYIECALQQNITEAHACNPFQLHTGILIEGEIKSSVYSNHSPLDIDPEKYVIVTVFNNSSYVLKGSLFKICKFKDTIQSRKQRMRQMLKELITNDSTFYLDRNLSAYEYRYLSKMLIGLMPIETLDASTLKVVNDKLTSVYKSFIEIYKMIINDKEIELEQLYLFEGELYASIYEEGESLFGKLKKTIVSNGIEVLNFVEKDPYDENLIISDRVMNQGISLL